MISLKLTILLVLTVLVGQSQGKNFIDQPYIEVSGRADTLVTPDEIFIRILLSEKDTRDRISIEDLELKMVNTLKMLSLDPEENLTTSDMSSNFKYYLLKSKDVIKTKIYQLKVKNAFTASQVFIKLEEIGISNTSIERVAHTDIENIKNLMRTKAIGDAKARAVALTKSLNQSVSFAIHIVDAENFNMLSGKIAGIQIRGVSTFENSYNELRKIEFEKIKIESNINVKFILK